jgi:purine-binding chemotaxis protein CheW
MNAQLLEAEVNDSLEGKYLIFMLGRESYGIEIRVVTEIIGIQNISIVPNMPDYIKGVINLRGKIIPVIDVRLRFQKDPMFYNDRTCIIVVEIENKFMGLVVDKVADVVNIANQDIVPPPDGQMAFLNRYIKGIGKIGNEIKLLVDYDMFLQK